MNRQLSSTGQAFSFTISSHPGIENTPFNPLWAAVSPLGLRFFDFGISQEEFLETVTANTKLTGLSISSLPDPALVQVVSYLNAERKEFSIPIDESGFTGFQKAVYRAVREIPYGETRTYDQIGRKLGKTHAARAVGAANSANPLPIIIPCHRLVGVEGSLRGYGGKGGIKTKQWLLDLEKNMGKSNR